MRNKADDEGLAVMSLGMVEQISRVNFDSNTKHCGSGTYGFEMKASEAEVRYAVDANLVPYRIEPSFCLDT